MVEASCMVAVSMRAALATMGDMVFVAVPRTTGQRQEGVASTEAAAFRLVVAAASTEAEEVTDNSRLATNKRLG
jgi:hypothetical protein